MAEFYVRIIFQNYCGVLCHKAVFKKHQKCRVFNFRQTNKGSVQV
jgi:hypothetical protein